MSRPLKEQEPEDQIYWMNNKKNPTIIIGKIFLLISKFMFYTASKSMVNLVDFGREIHANVRPSL
ncbi:Uncharacterised protein [Weeksella virosa]|nr:Uncharacterised protein [Weeksella virosa]